MHLFSYVYAEKLITCVVLIIFLSQFTLSPVLRKPALSLIYDSFSMIGCSIFLRYVKINCRDVVAAPIALRWLPYDTCCI